jgi:hypothetical protein
MTSPRELENPSDHTTSYDQQGCHCFIKRSADRQTTMTRADDAKDLDIQPGCFSHRHINGRKATEYDIPSQKGTEPCRIFAIAAVIGYDAFRWEAPVDSIRWAAIAAG